MDIDSDSTNCVKAIFLLILDDLGLLTNSSDSHIILDLRHSMNCHCFFFFPFYCLKYLVAVFNSQAIFVLKIFCLWGLAFGKYKFFLCKNAKN
ncbi:hypothetical protein BpHYR1_037406 [Brachionus plicatilis]|uniref:Uncharacterized protein n=1 Tax=Brachionus plicatilis TaxID=10195 RepID=A0A3M7SQF9_BRAPC|nr:hypothetical protein BpHYR1_037406 [Brachionus plicatilis]